MATTREYEADGGVPTPHWHWQYRSRAYALAKNYGVRPGLVARVLGEGLRDAGRSLRAVMGGDGTPSRWLGNGRDVLSGLAIGFTDGVRARRRDGAPRRNPNGRSMRTDRVVDVYD